MPKPKSPRVLITGVTSFTGYAIARAFVDAGYEVAATLTRTREAYNDELMEKRIEASKVSLFFPSSAFGTKTFVGNIHDFKPDVFINHGAAIEGYRSADFDYLASLKTSLHEARLAMTALKSVGCTLLLHTGSVFEPGEGFADNATTAADFDQPGLSLYGVSKKMVWEALRFFAEEQKLRVTKIVVPNPIGPLENTDRLIPTCVRLWKAGDAPKVFTPELVRDHLPTAWLAQAYVRAVRDAGSEATSTRTVRPSGFRLRNVDLVKGFAEHFRRAGFTDECPVVVEPRPTSDVLKRVNGEPVPELGDPRAIANFWSEYARSFL